MLNLPGRTSSIQTTTQPPSGTNPVSISKTGLNLSGKAGVKSSNQNKPKGFVDELAGYFGGNLGTDVRNIITGKAQADPNRLYHEVPIVPEMVTGVRQSLEDVASGKDIGIMQRGLTPQPIKDIEKATGKKEFNLGDVMWQAYGKNLPFQDQAYQKKTEATMANPNILDVGTSAFNTLTAPFLVKSLAETPLKMGAKALGKEIPDILWSNKDLANNLITGGQKVAGKFGEFADSPAAHYNFAKLSFPDTSLEEINSPQGRHLIDWVSQQAGKINKARGATTTVQNSDVIQAWADAQRIWGPTIKTASQNMEKYATDLDRVLNGTNGLKPLFSSMGIDTSKFDNLTLYSTDYATRVSRNANTKFQLLTNYLEKSKQTLTNKNLIPEGTAVPKETTIINNSIKAIKLLEKQIGHRIGFGGENFVQPSTINRTLQLTDKVAKSTPETANQNPIVGAIKTIFDPQIFTNQMKNSLVNARFNQELIKRGLDPKTVYDRVGALYQQGMIGDFNFYDKNLGNYKNIFSTLGADAGQKILDARKAAEKLPFNITGLNTLAMAQRIPGASPVLQKIYGARWGSNPLFQVTKIPTKLYEIAAASGIGPRSAEVNPKVLNYLLNKDKPMVSRIINSEMLELQYQSKWWGGEMSKKWLSGAQNPISKKVYSFIDHIMNADEHVYSKAVYKSFKDQGYDWFNKLPVEDQMDQIKNIPIDVLGRADNFAKSLTRYGQGTSPLQNTMNTIFFPMLFHAKVAKFALTGALTHPIAARTIAQFITVQNDWAMSPEGQLWHQTPGIEQGLLHMIGSAEPVNIPAMTGRQETPGQTISRFSTPYNPVSPVLQMVKDLTGINIPGSQVPSSQYEISNPIPYNLLSLTGYGSIANLPTKLGLTKGQFPVTLKSVTKQIQKKASGAPPNSASLKQSMRNFAQGKNPSDIQKRLYAEYKADLDFPDDKTKQQAEIKRIMGLWNTIHFAQ